MPQTSVSVNLFGLVAAARLFHYFAARLAVGLLLRFFSHVFPIGLWSLGDGEPGSPCSSHPGSVPVAAQLVKDSLTVSTYGEVVARRRPPRGKGHGGGGEAETCAVCLRQLRRRDRVRVPRNCPHLYHRRCLDLWIDHDEQQATCPLCRAPLLAVPPRPPPTRRSRSPAGARLVPSGGQREEQPGSWAVEQLLYLFGDDWPPAGATSPPASSSSRHRREPGRT